MLDKEPENRITIQEALAHPFFEQIDPVRIDEYGDGNSSVYSQNTLGIEVEENKIEDPSLKLQDPPTRSTGKKMGKGQPTQKLIKP